jgi:hypothetical protein
VDPWGVPLSRSIEVPSANCTAALSHRSIYTSVHAQVVCFRTSAEKKPEGDKEEKVEGGEVKKDDTVKPEVDVEVKVTTH